MNNNHLSIKTILLAAAMSLSASLQAQTAKNFTVNISADGDATMQVFLPENPTGRFIVDCPGGGYSHLSMQNEGTDWAEWFTGQGIAFGVLKYRMPAGDRSLPMSDAQAAVKMARDSAQAWGVNPYDVGIMGFSAGGHLASTTACHAPDESRPDFQILFYPVISMEERETHKGSVVNFLGQAPRDEKLVKQFSNFNSVYRHKTPPAIIMLAGDDTAVPALTNGVHYYTALRKAGIPAALMVWPKGGHGFGFRNTFAYHDQLLAELKAWLENQKPSKADAVKVACIGNSITDGWGIDYVDVNGYPAQLQSLLGQDYIVKNFGVSGRTQMNSGNRPYMNEDAWTRAKAFEPNIVVIKLGTNDSKPVNWDGHEAEYEGDLQSMIDQLKALPSTPKIYLCLPIKSADKREEGDKDRIRDSVVVASIIPIINKVAKNNSIEVIDLYNTEIAPGSDLMSRDQIHPTAKGAKVIAKAVYEAIKD